MARQAHAGGRLEGRRQSAQLLTVNDLVPTMDGRWVTAAGLICDHGVCCLNKAGGRSYHPQASRNSHLMGKSGMGAAVAVTARKPIFRDGAAL